MTFERTLIASRKDEEGRMWGLYLLPAEKFERVPDEIQREWPEIFRKGGGDADANA